LSYRDLEVLRDTRSLTDEAVYLALVKKLEQLGKQLNRLVSGVDRDHRSVRESLELYDPPFDDEADRSLEVDEAANAHPASSIQDPAS
jgi:hypothetical protein